MEKKCIFLDIDGVLNNSRTKTSILGYTGISNSLIKRLAKIVKETGADIILTSTWKEFWMEDDNEFYPYMAKKFRQAGLRIVGKTNGPHERRGYVAVNYAKRHGYDKYIFLDDETFDYDELGLTDVLVLTDSDEGLTNKDAERAIELLKK